jgi:MinD-like ATPase involved in chromosome partitioning or flagellar assembly
MELPTYTNIWKIEKRLYKLYDFRLPMPLPIGQLAAFLVIATPYMLALTLVGMPFSHTWVWLYVLPPGAAAWLVTRPVLEGKRLPELVLSQVRYLAEPRSWCRLAPLAEEDNVVVVARVWRAPAGPARDATAEPDDMNAAQARLEATARPEWPDRPAASARIRAFSVGAPVDLVAPAVSSGTPAADATPAAAGATITAEKPVDAAGADAAAQAIGLRREPDSHADAWDEAADEAAITGVATARVAAAEAATAGVAAAGVATAEGGPAEAATAGAGTAAAEAALTAAAEDDGIAAAGADEIAAAADAALHAAPVAPRPAVARTSPPVRPVIRVRADSGGGRPLHMVERALRTSRGGWQDRVVVVPGGHRPGSPDHAQRDQARSRLPLAGPARIVVIGTTAGAGQTVTTLLTGQLLASLRGEAVAVLDLGGRPGSLTELARQVPRLLPSRLASGRPAGDQSVPDPERGLQVVTADHSGPGPRDADRLIDAVVARYPITLADPPPADVPRAVQVADQLVLVTAAGATSAASLAMTLEWLEAHGHGRLAQTSVTVLNGVSTQTAEDAERATTVAVGRCRAIVRVPWDSSFSASGQLGTATVHAYTALAGVLVSGLADPALAASAGAGSAGQ